MSQTLDYAVLLPKPPKRWRRGLIGWVLFCTIAALFFVWLKPGSPSSDMLPLSTFYAQVKAQNVSRLMIDGDEVSGRLIAPITFSGMSISVFRTNLPPGVSGNWNFSQWLIETSPSTEVKAEASNNLLNNIILPIIPWLLIGLFIYFFVFRQLRKNASSAQRPLPVIVVNPEGK